jgi:hypothetical protein
MKYWKRFDSIDYNQWERKTKEERYEEMAINHSPDEIIENICVKQNLTTKFKTKEEVKQTVEVLTHLHKEATKENETDVEDSDSDEDNDRDEDNDSDESINEELTKKMATIKIDDIVSYGNKQFGNSFEEVAIKQYEQLFNVSIEINIDDVKRAFYEGEKRNWLVGGRIDGLLENDTVIEVKNRMRCFIKTIPLYEQIQLSTYMFAKQLNKSILIEKYNDNIKTTPFNFNPWWFENVVLQKLKRFCLFMEKFCVDDELKETFIMVKPKDEQLKEDINKYLKECLSLK